MRYKIYNFDFIDRIVTLTIFSSALNISYFKRTRVYKAFQKMHPIFTCKFQNIHKFKEKI